MMTEDDVRNFTVAASATLVVGLGTIALIFYCLEKKLGGAAARADGAGAALRPRLAVEAAAMPPSATANATAAAASAPKPAAKQTGAAVGAAPTSIAYVPLAAAATMVQRGNRLLAEKNPRDALVCFLSLLYSAQGGDHGALPSHLTDCLRGAAQCFIALGDPDQAVKFLQAERRVFEEMLAATVQGGASAPQNRPQSGALLASLLDPTAADTPHRCNVLRDVAEACSKGGHEDIALAYRVKVAALKQKVSGKPMDPNSKEFHDLAKSLSKLASYDKREQGGEEEPAEQPPPSAATSSTKRSD